MLLDTDINAVVEELEIHAALYDGMKYDESNRMAGFAAGMQDALELACSILRCQREVRSKRQWEALKAQLFKVASIGWANSEKEPPGYFDGFCRGRRRGARLALLAVEMRNSRK